MLKPGLKAISCCCWWFWCKIFKIFLENCILQGVDQCKLLINKGWIYEYLYGLVSKRSGDKIDCCQSSCIISTCFLDLPTVKESKQTQLIFSSCFWARRWLKFSFCWSIPELGNLSQMTSIEDINQTSSNNCILTNWLRRGRKLCSMADWVCIFYKFWCLSGC